jgi:hypothetical protein
MSFEDIGDLRGRRGATRPSLVPEPVLRHLEEGNLETVNLMEQIALDMPSHFRNLFPTLTYRAEELSHEQLVARMRVGGQVLLDEFRPGLFDTAPHWVSDTARGGRPWQSGRRRDFRFEDD